MMAMVRPSEIRQHMSVVCSDDGQFATSDHPDATNTIELTKDDQGQHRPIPMGWVTRVDEHVHVDRPGKQAMQDRMSSLPSGA